MQELGLVPRYDRPNAPATGRNVFQYVAPGRKGIEDLQPGRRARDSLTCEQLRYCLRGVLENLCRLAREAEPRRD